MNGNADAASAWLKKAKSDLGAAELCVASGKALDAACFHCQQAAEKSIKAWLIAHQTTFPFVHDPGKLLTLCATLDQEFEQLRSLCAGLTPFAVALRYDAEFWPTAADAEEALHARSICDFVVKRWPGA